MGTWGITERESDVGLDQLDLITVELLEPNGFEVFNVADAMTLLRKNILAQIELSNRGCSPEDLKSHIEESYPREFTHAALLLAECIGDYYQNCYLKTVHQFEPAEVEALLEFADPLQAAYLCWEENSHEYSFPICDLLKETKAKDHLPLAETKPLKKRSVQEQVRASIKEARQHLPQKDKSHGGDAR